MTNDRGTRTRPEDFGRRVLPAEALTRAPKAVATANAAAAEALDGYRNQLAAQRQADIDARNADQADRDAVKAALDQGKQAPKATANAKREAVDHARNITTAAYSLAADRFAALDQAIQHHHHEWIEAERATLADTAAEAQKAVEKASAAFATFEQRTGLVGFLAGYEPGRDKTQQVRPGSVVLADTETVSRNPAALLTALRALTVEYAERLTTTPTVLEWQAAEAARNTARRAIRHQQRQEQDARRRTTTWVT